tara:strand:+ start:859 stop:1233 length:375 start_codon:yes stop_codon:yes gene_type:complete
LILGLDASQLLLLSNDILNQITEEYEDTILAVRNELVRTTPVDTSKARKNWQMDEQLNSDVLPATGFASFLTSVHTGFTVDFRKNVHIFNNVDYVSYLDEGTPTMAPLNFIPNAITSVIRRLNN